MYKIITQTTVDNTDMGIKSHIIRTAFNKYVLSDAKVISYKLLYLYKKEHYLYVSDNFRMPTL